ncbi:DUF4376 domain-containing protein [Pseudomonas sp. V88_4]|uniref:DUF4376 domain-containing protein n=1 Tax=Pseudomonas sp. V88_4 TaxID=3044229 RepID=UPI00249F2615|nr:DUF4376 domain-containing protein [Pseudomonas sp. V88_4]MDI3399695.1 DUF4376 domain-containing protein [Pseudomonas sp. V88_4]
MLRAYSNSGTAFRCVAQDWPLADGEILFDHEPTVQELEDAFGFATGELVVKRQLELIAQERFRRESSGIVVDGVAIDTSRDSQSLIAGMAVSAILDPAYQCSYKAVAGFIDLRGPQILQVAKAVRSHVQACFDREKALSEAARAGTCNSEMLIEGWPEGAPQTPPENLQ